MKSFIKFEERSILHVPIHNYEQTFTFIINEEEFHISQLGADLLSPKIYIEISFN